MSTQVESVVLENQEVGGENLEGTFHLDCEHERSFQDKSWEENQKTGEKNMSQVNSQVQEVKEGLSATQFVHEILEGVEQELRKPNNRPVFAKPVPERIPTSKYRSLGLKLMEFVNADGRISLFNGFWPTALVNPIVPRISAEDARHFHECHDRKSLSEFLERFWDGIVQFEVISERVGVYFEDGHHKRVLEIA